MTTGEKIKELRKNLGITQTELGEKLGVKKNAVSKWECGRVDDIPASKIKAMSALFSVPTSYLIDADLDAKKTLTLTIEDERTMEFVDLFTRLTESEQDFLLAQIKGVLASR